jgi:hypothetical protein
MFTGPPPATPQDLTPVQILLAWIALGLIAWKLSVDAHILRHALETPFAFGFLLALTWTIAAWAVDRIAFAAAG